MKRQYLVTERAHYMCPNMHFGMLFELNEMYQEERVHMTLDRLVEVHPFLRSLLGKEADSGRLYYAIQKDSQIILNIRENIGTLWKDYEELSKQNWNVLQMGLLRIYIYPKDSGMTVLLVAHHLLADGRGLLELAEEFADVYCEGRELAYAPEQLMENITDLPAGSRLSGISRMLIRQANRLWEKEDHRVSSEQYEQFVKVYQRSHDIEYQTYEIGQEAVAEMQAQCREHGFTMNDLLMAHMYQKAGTDKIIIAADIRKSFAKYQRGAMGNYATALGITCKSRTTDTVEKAKEIHKMIQKKQKSNRDWMLVLACYFEMDPELLDAAAIAALGGFESKAGRFVGGGMFGLERPSSYSITNLGRTENPHMQSLLFIPPASPAAKLTLGVVTLNGILRACSSKNLCR